MRYDDNNNMISVSVTGVKDGLKNKCGCFYSISRRIVIKRKGELLKKCGWLTNNLKNCRLTAAARAARGIEFLLDIEHLTFQVRVVVDSIGHLFVGITDGGRTPVA